MQQPTPFITELASSGSSRVQKPHNYSINFAIHQPLTSSILQIPERKVRDRALESLTKFLQARRDLSLLDMLKVWKGLFYCVYHSDRPRTQQALARALARLVADIPRDTVQTFLRAFWITMGREWHGIDRLRLDKYLFLIRCYVGAGFSLFLRPGGEEEEADGGQGAKRRKGVKGKKTNGRWDGLAEYISMLEKGALSTTNFEPDEAQTTPEGKATQMPKGPDGLRYHVMDVWIDELENVVVDQENEGRLRDKVPMDILLRPIYTLQKHSITKTVRLRAAETLRDERLVQWGVVKREEKHVGQHDQDGDDGDDDDEDEDDGDWGGFDEGN